MLEETHADIETTCKLLANAGLPCRPQTTKLKVKLLHCSLMLLISSVQKGLNEGPTRFFFLLVAFFFFFYSQVGERRNKKRERKDTPTVILNTKFIVEFTAAKMNKAVGGLY